MKKMYLFSLIALFAIELGYSQPILPGIFGQNANRTATIGVNTTAGGDLDKYWDDVLYPGQNYTKESKGKFMRYGGIPLDQWGFVDGDPLQGFPTPSNIYLTIDDYIKKAKIIQDNGMIPMMTLPLNENIDDDLTFATAATAVTKLVKGVNEGLVAAGAPYTPVLYWVYSNEPEEGGGIHLYNDDMGAKKIHDYIQAYYNAVNGPSCWNPGWGTPVFVGPELYNFDNYTHPEGLSQLIDQLTGNYLYPPAGDCNILDYIDIFSVHYYPFGSEAKYAGYQPHPTRDNVVKTLTQNVPTADLVAYPDPVKSLEWEITNLQSKLAAYPNIKVGITETNICYQNEVGDPDYNYTQNNPTGATFQTGQFLNGYGTNSFIAGQFWAEIMAVCMKTGVSNVNFWSSLEGYPFDIASPTPEELTYRRNKTNLGYIDDSTFQKKPTYYHFQMMAKNFKGNYLQGNVTGGAPSYFKAFASQFCSQVKVMVMNQNIGPVQNVTVRLNNDPIAGGSIFKVNIPAGLAKEYTFQIGGEETVLLFFDGCGNIVSRTVYNITKATNNLEPEHFPPSALARYCSNCHTTPLLRCSTGSAGGDNENKFGSVTLTSSILITDSAWFEGIIRVPNGVTLTIESAEVVLSSQAQIEVLPGGKLVIVNSYLHGCDGAKWPGIEVKGNNNISDQLIINRSKITDAVTTVNADKTNGILITGNLFSDGTTAIEMNRNKGFIITDNEISNFTYGIKTSNTLAGDALIKENYFSSVKYAIYSTNDNHSKLDITCNKFENYSDYAVKSTGSTLKNQGTPSEGAGNTFNSSSVLLNNKFSHNGNAITYYVDPSNPITLTTGMGMNTLVATALADGCSVSSYRMPNNNNAEPAINILNVSLDLIPNPNAGQASIYFGLGEEKQGELIIMDIYGKTIDRIKVTADANKVDVNYSEYANGIYMVSLRNSKGETINKKMIITK